MCPFFAILFLVSCVIELLSLIAGFYIIYKSMIHTKIGMFVDRVMNTMMAIMIGLFLLTCVSCIIESLASL